MRRSAVSCEHYQKELPGIAGEGDRPSVALAQHLDECAGCRDQLVRYRRLLWMLSDLRLESERLPAGLLSDVVDQLSRAAERRALSDILARRRSLFLLVAGIVAVAVSVPLGVLRTRTRAAAAGAAPAE